MKISNSRNIAVWILLVIGAMAGLWIAADYGQSWDEWIEDQIGYAAIKAYSRDTFLQEQNADFHGTFYFMLYAGLPRLLARLQFDWNAVVVRHSLNYITFLVSILATVKLVGMLFGMRPAILTGLLILGQPLYFGHAFINHKDMPFMAFFAASVTLGVAAVRTLAERDTSGMERPPRDTERPERRLLRSMRTVQDGLDEGSRVGLVGLLQVRLDALKAACFGRSSADMRTYGHVLLAGIVLGMTSAVRVIGPFAGLLVGLYMLAKLKRRALPALLLYGLTAMVTTYLLWPALWGDPVQQFWERLSGAARFQQIHTVLFEGTVYRSDELPIHYLPKLLLSQFTEPVVIALPIGLYMSFRSFRRKEFDRALAVVTALWFLLPFLAQTLFAVPIYGNFRQLLFITIPLLIIAGYGWHAALERLSHNWVRILVMALALAPGILHIIRFHPYEYVYYNAFLGGVAKSEGRYELDYWCTSYRESMEYVNSIAAPGSRVVAWGPVNAARAFARPEVIVKSEEEIGEDPDFALACDNALFNEDYYRTFRVVHEVTRGGAVLGRVKARVDS